MDRAEKQEHRADRCYDTENQRNGNEHQESQ